MRLTKTDTPRGMAGVLGDPAIPPAEMHGVLRTPVGALLVRVSPRGVVSVEFSGENSGSGGSRPRGPRREDPSSRKHLGLALRQLEEYFQGQRREFDLPLDLRGTEFERRVWRQLTRIPHGRTRSYAEVARAIGKPGAARAAGGAIGRNPVSIIVPCHRVIGANGSLTGFGGGLPRKRWLLDHESGARRLSLPPRES